MRKILLITIIVIGLAGFVYYQGTTSQNADPAASVPQAPSNNIDGDVNVCIGSADYCNGLAEAQKQSLEYQNEQFKLQLTAMAPTPIPTQSPDDITRENREKDAQTTVLVVAFWAVLIIGILAALLWLAWQLYVHFIIIGPRKEKSADITESKDGKLIVARLPGDVNHADARDQWIALDRNAMGAQLIHVDGHGIAHQLKLSDAAAQYVAISNAISAAASRNQAQQFMTQLLDQWTRNTNSTIQTLGDVAANWKGNGRARTMHVPSKMKSIIKAGEPGSSPETDASVKWEGDGKK